MNICIYIYEYVFFFIRWYIIYAYLAISCMQIHNSKHKQTPQIIRFESKYMIGILHSSSQLYTVYLCFSNIVEVAAIFILQSIPYNFATHKCDKSSHWPPSHTAIPPKKFTLTQRSLPLLHRLYHSIGATHLTQGRWWHPIWCVVRWYHWLLCNDRLVSIGLASIRCMAVSIGCHPHLTQGRRRAIARSRQG